jgi:hypothetical protein
MKTMTSLRKTKLPNRRRCREPPAEHIPSPIERITEELSSQRSDETVLGLFEPHSKTLSRTRFTHITYLRR